MQMRNREPDASDLRAVLEVFGAWGDVREHRFIIDVEATMTKAQKKLMRKTLLDSDTALVAYLLLWRHYSGGAPFTKGE